MKIADQSLREKVAAVWNEALATDCGSSKVEESMTPDRPFATKCLCRMGI
jgi:hypothetical protein